MFLARWTHEAAREGTVPLCGDDIWNPRTSLASPHSGLMKQPTKEGSVWEGSVWEGSVRSIAQSIQEVLPSLRPHESPVHDHARVGVPPASSI